MLDEQGIQTFFQQVHEFWIQPELANRFDSVGLPENFKIWEALIKLPQNEPAIVEFNDEISWELKFKVSPNIDVQVDQTVYLHEVENIEQAMPPRVNDKRVAFIYLFWSGYSYRLVFDFSPNAPDFDANIDEFNLGFAIANHLKNKIIETTVRLSRNVEQQLRQIGLWVIPCLLPYPISKIIERIGEGKIVEARSVLVNHCDNNFIESLVETWKPIKVFNDRREVFHEAVFAHKNAKFNLVIYTLVPQIEGIITDWLYPIINPNKKIQACGSKERVKQFADLIQKVPEFEFAYRESLLSTLGFLVEGQPLQRFEKWLGCVDILDK